MASIANITPSFTLSTKHEFVEKIKYAQTQDKQPYTLDNLNPVNLRSNALTPSFSNILFSPYVIAKNMYSLATKKIEATFIKYELKTQVALNLLNFINMGLKATLLLTYFSLFTTQITFLSPFIVILAAISSLVGISHSCYFLVQQNTFLKRFDFTIFDLIINLKRDLRKNSPSEVEKNLKVLVNKLYSHQAIPPAYVQKLEEFSKTPLLSKEDLGELKILINKIQTSYLSACFKTIKEKYFSFTNEEKQKQLEKALDLYKTYPPEVAYKKSLEMIDAEFLRKKLNLTGKIHPKLTLETIEKIDLIEHELLCRFQDDKEPREATLHLRKIQKNAEIKKKVLITNIGLYSINLTLAALSYFAPIGIIASTAIVGVSMCISWLNHIDIYGKLESTKHHLDLYNCLPEWAKWIHQKIFFKQQAQSLANKQITPLHHQVV